MSYKTETHLHNAESSNCAVIKAEEGVELHKRAGYKTIIFTNHYSHHEFSKIDSNDFDIKINHLLEGYHIAKKLEKENDMNILYGIEVTLLETKSDYLIYGIDEKFLRENKYLYELSLAELYELCVANKFLLIQAHPFRDNMQLAPPNLIMGMEVYNGCPFHKPHARNELAEKYAVDNKLYRTSGSDFHRIEDLATGGIITENEIKTIDDFINVIKSNNFEIITN